MIDRSVTVRITVDELQYGKISPHTTQFKLEGHFKVKKQMWQSKCLQSHESKTTAHFRPHRKVYYPSHTNFLVSTLCLKKTSHL